MKIFFSIDCRAGWGETLCICGDTPQLGSGKPEKAVEMRPVGPWTWELSIELKRSPRKLRYTYFVKLPDGSLRREWGKPREFTPCRKAKTCRLFDSWEEMPPDHPFHSSAFTDVVFRRLNQDAPPEAEPGSLRLRVAAPAVRPDETVAVVGSCDALGNWDPAKAVRLNDSEFPFWSIDIPLSRIGLPCEYKFLILKKETVAWENSSDRIFNKLAETPDEQIIIGNLQFGETGRHWRGAGTAIPVFSLRSADDLGCGDFLDLKKMVGWCAKTGQRFLQTLPVNDTTKTKTWTDSYPYSANSSFALHPAYVRPQAVGKLRNAARREHFAKEGERLNALPAVDYEAATALKELYMREIYAQYGKSHAASDEYKAFVDANAGWLMPYAVWRTLRDRFGTPDHSQWGEYSVYDSRMAERFLAENAEETGFFIFEQFHLDRQLREVRDFAHANGVVLKGDIPIGVGRESVDAWVNPRLFRMDCQAGAPPDDFSVLGQNWGFPTYDWEEMATDGFKWWKDRFAKMSEYFDAYRIDHILGFFRIWEIPTDAVHGLLGHFNPALPYSPEELRHDYDFWIRPSEHTKPIITDGILTEVFGSDAEEARQRFLVPSGEGRYRLRPEFGTQKKVAEAFSKTDGNDSERSMAEGLLRLLDDVLFIEDPIIKGHYHPRISAWSTFQYRSLSDYERRCFDRLYDDFYYHRHNAFWAGKALWKLPPIIFSTGMLACAEDLGMIPACVPEVMDRLQILTLEIPRMPKNPSEEFGDTRRYPYLSVCTSSTHDMAGIRGWWESDSERSRRYHDALGLPGAAPYFAEPWICRRMLDMLLESPSMLCINPLQDWLAADGDLRRKDPREEQINDPANPKHYWRYRMHLTLDELLDADSFNESVRKRIAASGRS